MTKVLVTGVAGYIGSVLSRMLLEEGYYVVGIDNGQRNHCDSVLEVVSKPRFKFYYGNVSEHRVIQKIFDEDKPDYVVHLAASVGMPICEKFKEFSYRNNTECIKTILSCDYPETKHIFASTGSVYGALKEICTETSTPNPLSSYGIAKLEAEKTLQDYSSNYTIFRYATAFGVSPNIRLDLLPNELVYRAVTDNCLTIFQADFARTFIHIRDFSNAIMFSMKHFDRFKGEIFNVGDESLNWTKRQLAEYIKEKTRCEVFYANRGYEDIDKRDYVVDYSKIKKTGWKIKVSMEEGIDELIVASKFLGVGNSRYRDKLI